MNNRKELAAFAVYLVISALTASLNIWFDFINLTLLIFTTHLINVKMNRKYLNLAPDESKRILFKYSTGSAIMVSFLVFSVVYALNLFDNLGGKYYEFSYILFGFLIFRNHLQVRSANRVFKNLNDNNEALPTEKIKELIDDNYYMKKLIGTSYKLFSAFTPYIFIHYILSNVSKYIMFSYYDIPFTFDMLMTMGNLTSILGLIIYFLSIGSMNLSVKIENKKLLKIISERELKMEVKKTEEIKQVEKEPLQTIFNDPEFEESIKRSRYNREEKKVRDKIAEDVRNNTYAYEPHDLFSFEQQETWAQEVKLDEIKKLSSVKKYFDNFSNAVVLDEEKVNLKNSEFNKNIKKWDNFHNKINELYNISKDNYMPGSKESIFRGMQKGFNGENRLVKSLSSEMIPNVFYGLNLTNSNGESVELDALIVHDKGLTVIESKDYRADEIVIDNSGYFYKKRNGVEERLDTLNQVNRANNILKSILGRDLIIKNIIVLTDEDTKIRNNFNDDYLQVIFHSAIPFKLRGLTFKYTDYIQKVTDVIKKFESAEKKYPLFDLASEIEDAKLMLESILLDVESLNKLPDERTERIKKEINLLLSTLK